MPNHESLERVVVVGCCGAGKSIFSAELAHRLQVPHVERDALGELGSEAYRAAVSAALAPKKWIFDGPPYYVELQVYSVAEVVIWLDYAKSVALSRAVWRSIGRTLGSVETGKNQPGRLRQWIAPGGPYWTWQTYVARKQEFAALSCRPELATAQVLRFGRPNEACVWLDSLSRRQ